MAGREGIEPSRDIAASTHLAGGRTRPDYATSPHYIFIQALQIDIALLIKTILLKDSFYGGGRGIRTPGDITATVVFKTTAFVRSAIPPETRKSSNNF